MLLGESENEKLGGAESVTGAENSSPTYAMMEMFGAANRERSVRTSVEIPEGG